MNKNIKITIIFILILSSFSACRYRKIQNEITELHQIKMETEIVELKDINFPINLELFWGEAFNHPSFAIWMEDMEGNYIKTLFVTKSIATGIFGHAQASDSTWSAEPGKSFRPAALPIWFHKKGLLDDGTIVPTPEHPFVDAFVGATPTNNARLKSGTKETPKSKFRILMEINQTWDWNDYYHNNLYPKNMDYKSSAQPSLVYATTVDMETSFNEWYLNPIGHGHYAGENGMLYTDLSKHTTALQIIDKVIVRIQK